MVDSAWVPLGSVYNISSDLKDEQLKSAALPFLPLASSFCIIDHFGAAAQGGCMQGALLAPDQLWAQVCSSAGSAPKVCTTRWNLLGFVSSSSCCTQ